MINSILIIVKKDCIELKGFYVDKVYRRSIYKKLEVLSHGDNVRISDGDRVLYKSNGTYEVVNELINEDKL